jgi:hypothetical protein
MTEQSSKLYEPELTEAISQQPPKLYHNTFVIRFTILIFFLGIRDKWKPKPCEKE